MAKYRRKNFFFKKGPQGKIVFSYFIIAGLVTILFTLLFVYFSANTLSITYDNNNLHMGNTPSVLFDRLLGIHGILIFIFGFLIIYFATRFTHRFIGPIYKIETVVERMIKGEVNIQIMLRKKDDCKELADKLNRFNSILNEKLKEMEGVSIKLRETAYSEPEKAAFEPEALKRLSDQFDEILSHFTFSKDITGSRQ